MRVLYPAQNIQDSVFPRTCDVFRVPFTLAELKPHRAASQVNEQKYEK
jgi:hypothetical protein